MDFVVNKWVWNMDSVKQLAAKLQNAGFDVNIPQGESRLALWVNLASINKTKLFLAENEPETIEGQSTATNICIENNRVNIEDNKTATEQEQPIIIQRPVIKLGFANETTTLGGFFRFVSNATVTNMTGYRIRGDCTCQSLRHCRRIAHAPLHRLPILWQRHFKRRSQHRR